MILDFEVIIEDIKAFADDVSDVVVDRPEGSILFTRNGKDYMIKIIKKGNHIEYVDYDGSIILYKTFLSKHLAKLDSLAERISTKRLGIQAFIDGPATLDSVEKREKFGNALEMLKKECHRRNEYTTKVIFITADAGHGKTALLRQYQSIQASEYLNGKTNQLFWHIDLQGRQLLRLSEAFMGDLGELRVSGLWMSSIIRLMKHGLLVIGIDGFDELAAEQGNNEALSALALLVKNLENKGTIVAASRRTFFDTEDYLKRSKLIKGKLNEGCLFHQITLKDWGEQEVSLYAQNREIENPKDFYEEILNLLGRQSHHPFLTRPFLISKLVDAIKKYNISAPEFIGGMSNPQDPNRGVNSIIEAFLKREVEEKWKERETGDPYLNQEQHIIMLSAIAETMWTSHAEKIKLDVIQTITSLLLDDWGIDVSRGIQVFDMMKMHALLTPPDDNTDYRSFEHPEFKDYFTAMWLKKLLSDSLKSRKTKEIVRFLSIAQISDRLALYTFSNTELDNNEVQPLIELLESLVVREWKPTFLSINIGTMIPFILNEYDLDSVVEIKAKIIYSSLIFENKKFANFIIHKGSFLNISFKNSTFKNVQFIDCEMNEIQFNENSKFINCKFTDCNIIGIRKENDSKKEFIEYSPHGITNKLKEIGIEQINTVLQKDFSNMKPHKYSGAIHKLLRAMRKTTFINENNIINWFKREKGIILNDIIPLMVKHKILDSLKGKDKVWVLRSSYQNVSVAEYKEDNSNTHKFWEELRNKF